MSFACAAHRVIADVDPDLGLVRVRDITTAQDVGRILNPTQAVGQTEGGTAQGVGLALMEEIVLDNGLVRNASFTDYVIPTTLDMPDVTIAAWIEEPEPGARCGCGTLPAFLENADADNQNAQDSLPTCTDEDPADDLLLPAMPNSLRFLVLSRQDGLMDDNDSYWPEGFVAELIALFETEKDAGLISEKLEEMQSRAAEEIATSAIADPRLVLSERAGQRAAFEARLEARWGRGLDIADLVVNEAFECGRWVNDLLRPEAHQDHKFEALIRLHGKAVMTAREVMVLLRSGYSSGAMARWRTLHEVWVVFELLAEGDGEMSRRYLAHEYVESLRGQREYEETWEALGFEAPDWDPAERNEAQRELAKEFGKTFLNDYGWAARLLDKQRPKFRDLQERAGLDHWRGYYRLASHGTHANSKGITWNIQGSESLDVIWAAPSNAGLVDPAQCSLIALAGINDRLLAYVAGELPDSDDTFFYLQQTLVRQEAIALLMDTAVEALAKVGAEQEAEEEAMAELLSQATAILQEGSPMSAEGLSAELQVDPDDLAYALSTAVERGQLFQETTFHLMGSDTDMPEESDDA